MENRFQKVLYHFYFSVNSVVQKAVNSTCKIRCLYVGIITNMKSHFGSMFFFYTWTKYIAFYYIPLYKLQKATSKTIFMHPIGEGNVKYLQILFWSKHLWTLNNLIGMYIFVLGKIVTLVSFQTHEYIFRLLLKISVERNN